MSSNRLILDNFVPYALSVTSNEISHKIAQNYQQRFGIDLHQWRVLAVLGQESKLSAIEVGERTAMDKVAVSRAVKKLLSESLISREFAQEDKRRSILSITELGRNIYNNIVPIAKNYEMKLLANFSKEEITQIGLLLDKLRKANAGIAL